MAVVEDPSPLLQAVLIAVLGGHLVEERRRRQIREKLTEAAMARTGPAVTLAALFEEHVRRITETVRDVRAA